ncbi:type II toxin-antitoxin system HicA family toxin [Nodosilinea sp. PGN35]|uniref:type II toxin-antitoxin system HicA family toxin n=1 Tax=Nodosilinea sp. PGN35 TaxID=3020489 RepID=UPI0024141BB1|nr:type II toxin-antitoxin system HicA family toxin [Nodosilinea sp. TSF1-S3]
MPRLKRLSGVEIVSILERFDFQVYSQRGSHIKLRRESNLGKETLTVPNHRQLDTGTCRAIYRQACRYIPESELFPHFYQ